MSLLPYSLRNADVETISSALSGLGRDGDDAVTGAGAIKRRRGSALDDFDVFDVIRVDAREPAAAGCRQLVAKDDSVHDVERRAFRVPTLRSMSARAA